MGIFLLFLFFLLLVPLLVVGSTVLRLVFNVRAAFQPNQKGFFKNKSDNDSDSSTTSTEDGSIGHSELGRKRLNVLKNRATDVQFDVVEENS